jgi:hypothetical protein
MHFSRSKVEQIVREMEAAAEELVWDRMSPEDRGRLSGRIIILANEIRCEVAKQEPRIVHCTGVLQ